MIWQSLVPDMVAKSVEEVKDKNRATRDRDLEKYVDAYISGQRMLGQLYKHRREEKEGYAERAQRFCNFGFVPRLTDALVGSLQGKPIVRTIPDDKEGTATYRDVLKKNGYETNARVVTQGQVLLGGTYCSVTWSQEIADATNDPFAGVRIVPTSPLFCWPIEHPDDPTILQSIVEQRAHPTDPKNEANWIWMRDRYAVVDRYGRPVPIFDARGERIDGTESGWYDNPYGIIPIAYFRGLMMLGRYEGASAMRDVYQMQRLINNRASMIDRVVLYESHAQPVLADRRGPEKIILSETKALGLTDAGKFSYVSPGVNIEGIQATFDKLIDYLLMVGGFPKSVVVGGTASSGYQLEIEYRAMQEQADVIAVGIVQGERDLYRNVRAVLEVDAQVMLGTSDDLDVGVDRNVLPRDEDREFARDLLKFQNGLITVAEMVEKWSDVDKSDPKQVAEYISRLIADAEVRRKISPQPSFSSMMGGAI